jgi:hypothetical protein
MQSCSDIGYFQRSPPEVLLQTLLYFQSVKLLKSLKPRLDPPLQRLHNAILRPFGFAQDKLRRRIWVYDMTAKTRFFANAQNDIYLIL